jgi:hypothetical protein
MFWPTLNCLRAPSPAKQRPAKRIESNHSLLPTNAKIDAADNLLFYWRIQDYLVAVPGDFQTPETMAVCSIATFWHFFRVPLQS